MGFTCLVGVCLLSTIHVPEKRLASDGPVSSCSTGAASANK